MKKCLIVYGGWDGHEPEKIARRFEAFLKEQKYDVLISDSLSAFDSLENLKELDLIVPIWTMGEISDAQCRNVCEAVAAGCGLSGCHGGMCDAFRKSVLWQFMTGGNWVAHPGGDGVSYTVNMKNTSSSLTEGISDFSVSSEHYYLHVDPAVEVLATTRFPQITWYHSANGEVDMPVVWTKKWGLGRVFYNSLGHHDDIFDAEEPFTLMKRGLVWASEGKDYALKNNLSVEMYQNEGKMF